MFAIIFDWVISLIQIISESFLNALIIAIVLTLILRLFYGVKNG